MPSQRDKSKKLIGFYATPEEKAGLESVAAAQRLSVAELLRRIGTGLIRLPPPTEKPKRPG